MKKLVVLFMFFAVGLAFMYGSGSEERKTIDGLLKAEKNYFWIEAEEGKYTILCMNSDLIQKIYDLAYSEKIMVRVEGIVSIEKNGKKYIEVTTLPEILSLDKTRNSVSKTVKKDTVLPEELSVNKTKNSVLKTVKKDITSSKESNGLSEDTIKTMFLVVIISFFVIMILGASKTVVIYFDFADFLISIIPVISTIVALFLIEFYKPENGNQVINSFGDYTGAQKTVIIIAALLSIISIVFAFRLSVKYNKNIPLGILIGIFKIALGTLGILIIIGQIAKIINRDTSLRDHIIALILIGIFLRIGKSLINGVEVYEKKGWALQTES